MMDHKITARKLAESSAVLLKNDGALLPFAPGQKVAVFGWAQMDPILSGNGSGAAHNLQTEGYLSHLRAAALSPVECLAAFYAQETEERRKNSPPDFDFSQFKQTVNSGLMYEIFGRYSPNPKEFSIPQDLLRQAAAETDTALWIIGRKSGGEECDRHLEDDFFLSQEENTLLHCLCANFEKVTVVLNINGLIDLAWTKEHPQIKSLLFLGIPGEEGPAALANLLSGKVCPSGKLSVSVAKHCEDYPAWRDFSWDKEHPEAIRTYEDYGLTSPKAKCDFICRPVTVYREDIYLGYRYFDSFGIQTLYPFGFGLSYTEFTLSTLQVEKAPGGLAVNGLVRNTGAHSGSEVLQLYISCRGTSSNQPEKALKAFEKTPLLDPGQECPVTLTVAWRELATYQESSAAWVIEAGRYHLLLGNASVSTQVIGVVNVPQDIFVEQAANRLAMDKTYRNKLHLFAKPALPCCTLPEECPILELAPADLEPSYVAPLPLCDCSNLSDQQLAALCVGYGPGVPFSAFLDVPAPNTIFDEGDHPVTINDHPTGVNGYVSPAIPEKGIHSVFYKDGPAGIGRTGWPGEMLLACSFDKKLLQRFGDAVAQECEAEQVDLWLAPALNLHRHPLGGRNFEYFSEDPYLTGACAVAVLRGLQENHPVQGCAKHFVANEQETYRRGSAKQQKNRFAFDAVDSLVTERALRELYLKPFEMAVKEGNLHCIMTSFNKINGTFAAGNRDLCTHILRDEWGFDGLVVTDWGDMDIVVDGADAVAAGNDVVMPGGPPVISQILSGLEQGRITRKEMERAVAHLIAVGERVERISRIR